MSERSDRTPAKRDFDPSLLDPIDEELAASEDGLMINHDYSDMRGCFTDDLADAIKDDEQLFSDVAEVDPCTPEVLTAIADDHFEQSDYVFDPGVTAAIFAISAAGGTPITSCNGGWFGDSHSSDVAHVLFSIAPEEADIFIQSAKAAGCELINKGPFAEVRGDALPKMLALAKEVQRRL